MAKRNPDYVREKIQASKRLPDLAAAEIEIEQTQRYVVEIPPLLEVRTAD
jgi:hypothetical protein